MAKSRDINRSLGKVGKWLLAPLVRWLLLGVIGLVLVGMVYFNVWLVLTSGVPLPEGVGETAPELQLQLLEQVNSGRLERVQTAPVFWTNLTSGVFLE